METISDYKIREITSDDYMGLQAVYHAAWLDTYPNSEFGITAEDIEYRHAQRLLPEKIEEQKLRIAAKEENEIRLLAEKQGEIIALCNAAVEADCNRLQAIYVLPKYQGLGLGKVLWSEASKIFDRHKETRVNVASYNKKAIGFYEKLGFKMRGEIFFDEKFRMRNGVMMPEVTMVKKAEL